MQQYDEWLIDFQVQYGRKPSDKEVAEAAKTGFALSSGLSRQKNSKFRQVLSKVGLGDLKFSWFLVLEILLLICIALFGYVVGYLFIGGPQKQFKQKVIGLLCLLVFMVWKMPQARLPSSEFMPHRCR
ncbi:MAG: hypothetical protein ACLRUB_04845 [Streptococcus sp.]